MVFRLTFIKLFRTFDSDLIFHYYNGVWHIFCTFSSFSHLIFDESFCPLFQHTFSVKNLSHGNHKQWERIEQTILRWNSCFDKKLAQFLFLFRSRCHRIDSWNYYYVWWLRMHSTNYWVGFKRCSCTYTYYASY